MISEALQLVDTGGYWRILVCAMPIVEDVLFKHVN